MRGRSVLLVPVLLALLVAAPGKAADRPGVLRDHRATARAEVNMPKGFVPAVAASRVGRYFVVMKAPSVADQVRAAGHARTVSAAAQRATYHAALRSQDAAVRDAKSRGGLVVFRYGRLVNAFSARLSAAAAAALAARPDVASVQPVSIVKLASNDSTRFIGAPQVWDLGYRGQGMRVADVDTGIDYTHKDFGGPGTVQAYESNDPSVIEPGTFPTAKVIGGYDFTGGNYDVLDGDPNNDIPVPDPDPLDADGHGTHTSGTVAGFGVKGKVQRGVAPQARLYAVKVWDVGNSTDDVLVAGYEFAVDPNQDGSTDDKVDVLTFSGGVTYGTKNSVEAQAAQSVVDLGTVFVASAGNDGDQPAGGSAYVLGTPAAAPGVIAVAASIDAFIAQTLTVNQPSGVELPDNGLIVRQDWGGEITHDITGDVFDAREVDPPADPDNPQASDRELCDPVAGHPFTGKIVLVYKGSTGAGDCTGSLKAYNAEQGGATAVILWSGFGGFPFGLAPGDETVTIPVVMVSTNDGEVLGDTVSPDAANGNFNTQTLNVTINEQSSVIPGFEDSMTDFTSEGPARVTNDLKPDISAPGFDITSAGVGTGDGPAVLSGTSMAAPHVSGVATLLRQIHPNWSPGRIKAVLMNQAKLALKNNDLSTPVPATVMGAGRVQAFDAAKAVSIAEPASLSFGLKAVSRPTSMVRSTTVTNTDSVPHAYDAAASVRYSDYDPSVASVAVSTDGSTFSPSVGFNLAPGASQRVWMKLTLLPAAVSEADQELGWYYFHPGLDGIIQIQQSGGGHADQLHVSWAVVPYRVSVDRLSTTSLDVSGGPAALRLVQSGQAAGTSYADLYLLGTKSDSLPAGGEEDIAAIGARSFTGISIDGVASRLPTGTDALAGITWREFLTNSDTPTEPVEFGVEFYSQHDTTETLEVDVKVDAGADGVFADPGMRADYLIVKPPGRGGTTCVYDLSLPNPYDECAASYFADYSNYNSRMVGLVVDASAIGLSDGASQVAYQVTACTGTFSGDVPGQVCDTAGDFTGTTYNAVLDATHPALDVRPLTCRGFWGGGACTGDRPIRVSAGSAGPDEVHWILALFPNNDPTEGSVALVRVAT